MSAGTAGNVTLARPPETQELNLQAPPSRDLQVIATVAAIATAVFLVAYNQGGYTVEGRGVVGIMAWWGVLLVALLRGRPLGRPRGAAMAAAAGLTGLAFLSLASMAWASSGQNAFEEFNRVTLYLGLLLLVLVTARHGSAARWCDGIALGIAGVATLALVTRCFPQLINTTAPFRLLPYGRTRLNYPIGYWNGLAVLTAVGIPLFLRISISGRSTIARAAGASVLPLVGVVLYLTSSRTGTAAAVAAVLAYLVCVARRTAALAVVSLAGLGLAASLFLVGRRHALVDGPFDTAAARHEGWTFAVGLLAISFVVGVAYLAALRVTLRMNPPSPRIERAVLAGLGLLIVIAIGLTHPTGRFDDFKAPPSANAVSGAQDYVHNHLFSISGNGRWAFWTEAVREFQHDPIMGGGAGSYAEWWAQHRPFYLAVQDAHSLYVEMLGELGIPGFLLVVVSLGAGFVGGVRRLLRGDEGHRTTIAALLAGLAAFAVGAAGDWMWEVPVVGGLGVVFIGLLVGDATDGVEASRPFRRRTMRFALAGTIALAVAAIGGHAIATYADVKLVDSRAAFARGSGDAALHNAEDARAVEPWAASPYVQLALVSEQFGSLGDARRYVDQAARRDPRNWSIWLVKARLETKAGAIDSARRSLARARQLNPFGLPAATG